MQCSQRSLKRAEDNRLSAGVLPNQVDDSVVARLRIEQDLLAVFVANRPRQDVRAYAKWLAKASAAAAK